MLECFGSPRSQPRKAREGSAGNGLSAGRSIVSNSSRRLLPSFRMIFALSSATHLADGDIKFAKLEESLVAPPRHHESLNDLHRHFRFRFVARLFDSRRQQQNRNGWRDS